jgi:D-alanyl-D-alanine dipeptidase
MKRKYFISAALFVFLITSVLSLNLSNLSNKPSATATAAMVPSENKIPQTPDASPIAVTPGSSIAPTASPTAIAIAEPVKEIDGFVLLKDMDPDFIIDLRYATTDNFTKRKIYPDSVCVLRKATAAKLRNASKEFKNLGYRIKIWDAYRPVYVQRIFWNLVKDSRFVANPDNGGSVHNKGCAVDLTLTDLNGKELEMPSGFDDFSEKAYRNNSSMSAAAKDDLGLLTKIMKQNGFSTIDTEWWHYDDSDSKQYGIADVDLKLFLN